MLNVNNTGTKQGLFFFRFFVYSLRIVWNFISFVSNGPEPTANQLLSNECGLLLTEQHCRMKKLTLSLVVSQKKLLIPCSEKQLQFLDQEK